MATVVCTAPYFVAALLFIGRLAGVVLGPSLGARLALVALAGILLCSAATLAAWSRARRSQLLADRTMAAVCTVMTVAYLPVAGIASAIAAALAADGG